jgi:hypothetical protein
MKSPKTKKTTPEHDALEFLRWVLEVLEARGLRYVDERFALATMMMGSAILSPGNTDAESRADDAISAAGNFLEEFAGPGRGIPVAVLKASVTAIEGALREGASSKTASVTGEARA